MRPLSVKFVLCIVLFVHCTHFGTTNGKDWDSDEDAEDDVDNESNETLYSKLVLSALFQQWGLPVPDNIHPEITQIIYQMLTKKKDVSVDKNAENLKRLKVFLTNLGDTIHDFVTGPHYRPIVKKVTSFLIKDVATPYLSQMPLEEILKLVEVIIKNPDAVKPFLALRNAEKLRKIELFKQSGFDNPDKFWNTVDNLKKLAGNFFKEEL